MIRRLAVVIWWIGALGLGLAATSIATQLSERSECSTLKQEEQDVAQAVQAAEDEYRKQHPNANDYEVAAMASAPMFGTEKARKLTDCQRPFDYVAPGFLIACAAILWSLAFVLAGRFLLPPKTNG